MALAAVDPLPRQTVDSAQLQRDMGPGAADISEILPELSDKLEGIEKPPSLDAEGARFRLFLSITNFLKNLSQSQTLVVVLDDLHWADESSSVLLEFVTREIMASSILIVGGYRDVEIGRGHPLTETLGILDREEHFQRVQMEGLSRQEAGEFVEAEWTLSAPKFVTATGQAYIGEEAEWVFYAPKVVLSTGQTYIGEEAYWVFSAPKVVLTTGQSYMSEENDALHSSSKVAFATGQGYISEENDALRSSAKVAFTTGQGYISEENGSLRNPPTVGSATRQVFISEGSEFELL